MLSIDADHADHARSFNDLAFIAHFFDTGSNFHLFALIIRPNGYRGAEATMLSVATLASAS